MLRLLGLFNSGNTEGEEEGRLLGMLGVARKYKVRNGLQGSRALSYVGRCEKRGPIRVQRHYCAYEDAGERGD